MSHLTERKEKNCLNCGSEVLGRYCQVCGQENLEPKETVWHLVTHFVNDITHFDGKFFATLKYLLLKPGFLSQEYVRGRRMSYLHPIRMYVFTSAIFFVIFFSIADSQLNFKEGENKPFLALYKERVELQRALAQARDGDDSAELIAQLRVNRKIIGTEDSSIARRAAMGMTIIKDTLGMAKMGLTGAFDTLVAAVKAGQRINDEPAVNINLEKKEGHSNGLGGEILPSRVSAYDSMEAATPPGKRVSAIDRYINRRLVGVGERWKKDKKAFINDAKAEVLHTFPKILFISLPIFAFLLRLLYIRRRKQIFYVDHGIFTIHLYCATFILMLVLLGLQKIKDNFDQGWLSWLITLLFLSVFVYEFIAMKRFYRQGWFKTFLKWGILNTAAIILVGILTSFFAVWAVMEM